MSLLRVINVRRPICRNQLKDSWVNILKIKLFEDKHKEKNTFLKEIFSKLRVYNWLIPPHLILKQIIKDENLREIKK